MINILCRYEYFGPQGIIWTKWFTYEKDIEENKAQEMLKALNNEGKKEKYKHEYKIG